MATDKKFHLESFESDLEALIAACKRDEQVCSALGLFLDRNRGELVSWRELEDLIGDDETPENLVKRLKRAVKGTPFSLISEYREGYSLHYDKTTAYLLLKVVPGSNKEMVKTLNAYAQELENSKSEITISEFAITMGSEDLVVKIDSQLSFEPLSGWIIDEFQNRANENGTLLSTRTLAVLRDFVPRLDL